MFAEQFQAGTAQTDLFSGYSGMVGRLSDFDPQALFFWFGDESKTKLAGVVNEMEWPEEGLTSAERSLALAKLDTEIEKLESEKIKMIGEAGTVGLNISEGDVAIALEESDHKTIHPERPVYSHRAPSKPSVPHAPGPAASVSETAAGMWRDEDR